MNYDITIICINNRSHNVVINNNYRSLQDFILHFKIPTGKRKDFFEIYRKFGNTPSKRFSSHVIEHPTVDTAARYCLFTRFCVEVAM
jgi:hypothetical protein